MDNYVGKHLLIDCYGCKEETISSPDQLSAAIFDAAGHMDMEIYDTGFHQQNDELTVTAYGEGAQICIHAYPELHYTAIDIYCFFSDITPPMAMSVFRKAFRADKIRATSVKRGNLDAHPDMRPKTRSRTTTMRKFKNTGHQISATGKKVFRLLQRNHSADSRHVQKEKPQP